MIRLRNLHLGSGNFNGALIRGTSDIPFALSADSPMVDLQNIFWSLTTGWTGIRMTLKQGTTAQASGTNYVARFRGENSVNTSIGTLVGLNAQVANNNDSASLVIAGAVVEAFGKGKNASAIRGLMVEIDNQAGTGTITDMVGQRLKVGGAGTITNGPWGLQIINDSESAAASQVPLAAGIKLESAVVTTVLGAFADLTDCRLNNSTGKYSITLTANDNVLFYYKDKDGTAHAVVAADNDTLALRT